MRCLRRARRKPAVRGVDVEPQILGSADRRQLREWIDGSETDGSRRADHEKRNIAGSPIFIDGGAERVGQHSMFVIGVDPMDRSQAETRDVNRTPQPRVSFSRRVHAQETMSRGSRAFGADVPARLRAPSDDERDEVRRGAAAHQQASPDRRKPE